MEGPLPVGTDRQITAPCMTVCSAVLIHVSHSKIHKKAHTHTPTHTHNVAKQPSETQRSIDHSEGLAPHDH